MKVTACLLSYKRRENMGKIITHLLQQSFIDEILIKDNLDGDNNISFGRHEMAVKAKNHIVYFQDDDCLNLDIGKLHSSFLENPDKITHAVIEDFEEETKKNTYGETQMCMVGWGAFFKKDWIKYFDPYIAKHGADEIFYREADRIVSVLMNRHHNPVVCNIAQMPIHDDLKISLCNEKDHLWFKKESIRRALELYQA